jgi:hypothetical protein
MEPMHVQPHVQSARLQVALWPAKRQCYVGTQGSRHVVQWVACIACAQHSTFVYSWRRQLQATRCSYNGLPGLHAGRHLTSSCKPSRADLEHFGPCRVVRRVRTLQARASQGYETRGLHVADQSQPGLQDEETAPGQHAGSPDASLASPQEQAHIQRKFVLLSAALCKSVRGAEQQLPPSLGSDRRWFPLQDSRSSISNSKTALTGALSRSSARSAWQRGAGRTTTCCCRDRHRPLRLSPKLLQGSRRQQAGFSLRTQRNQSSSSWSALEGRADPVSHFQRQEVEQRVQRLHNSRRGVRSGG